MNIFLRKGQSNDLGSRIFRICAIAWLLMFGAICILFAVKIWEAIQ